MVASTRKQQGIAKIVTPVVAAVKSILAAVAQVNTKQGASTAHLATKAKIKGTAGARPRSRSCQISKQSKDGV